eukprot:CAMPEP_0206156598 /NCGR_PEP_ID=MMETSP1474-20131121/3113_1 /ASSEMBLY_ACC=CAM_ASM_001110 /TAXON_ID=97495 /ORGANISM="Imantonia sp., Strain RCC918" /LENGTH=191 /DNA_ID=CAMNT_0053555735 /DNA_START=42 /DNA_END=617 /DNA_ORIENTATION=-
MALAPLLMASVALMPGAPIMRSVATAHTPVVAPRMALDEDRVGLSRRGMMVATLPLLAGLALPAAANAVVDTTARDQAKRERERVAAKAKADKERSAAVKAKAAAAARAKTDREATQAKKKKEAEKKAKAAKYAQKTSKASAAEKQKIDRVKMKQKKAAAKNVKRQKRDGTLSNLLVVGALGGGYLLLNED